MSKICSSCRQPNDTKGRYCRTCHAAYMRDWRITNKLEGEAKRRDNSRSYANVMKKRGVLQPEPCCVCGAAKAEMHHPDHELPRVVVWFCRPCHLAWHKHWRDVARRTFYAWVNAARAPRRAA